MNLLVHNQKYLVKILKTFMARSLELENLNLKKYYNIALNEREELNYPPFSWITKLVFSGTKKSIVQREIENVYSELNGKFRGLAIIGPALCYREKLRDRYRFQIVFRSDKSKDQNGHKLHRFLKQNFGMEKNKMNRSGVKLSLDVNPVSLQ